MQCHVNGTAVTAVVAVAAVYVALPFRLLKGYHGGEGSLRKNTFAAKIAIILTNHHSPITMPTNHRSRCQPITSHTNQSPVTMPANRHSPCQPIITNHQSSNRTGCTQFCSIRLCVVRFYSVRSYSSRFDLIRLCSALFCYAMFFPLLLSV